MSYRRVDPDADDMGTLFIQYRNRDSGRVFLAGVDCLGGYAGLGLLGPDAGIVGVDAVLWEVG